MLFLLFQKDVCFKIFTLIKKTYQILITNTLFFVMNYSLLLLTKRILINEIMFFEIYNF